MNRQSDVYRAYALVIVGSGSYACLLFIWFILPAYLSVVIDELGLSGTQAGVAAGAVPLTYIPLALLSGLVVDRIGPARSIAIGSLIFGGSQMFRSFSQGFPSLLLTTIMIGIGATAITFAMPKLVSLHFPPDRTGVPSSIYLLIMSAGSAVAFGIGRPILGPWLGGWRPLFFWSGVVAVGYCFLWLLTVWVIRIDHEPKAGGDADSFSPTAVLNDLRLVLTNRDLQLVVIIGTMYLFVSHGMQGWLPTIFESRGLTSTRAGQYTSLFVVAYAAGIFIVPAIADRWHIRGKALIGCGSVLCVGSIGLIFVDTSILLPLAIVVAGLGTGGLSPLIRAIPPELDGIGARLTGTAVGFIFAVGEIGGFFGPVLIGVLYDVTGSYAPGLTILASAGLVVIAAARILY